MVVRNLEELIEAIDRRRPQIARASELVVAHEGALLRQRALVRLRELFRSRS